MSAGSEAPVSSVMAYETASSGRQPGHEVEEDRRADAPGRPGSRRTGAVAAPGLRSGPGSTRRRARAGRTTGAAGRGGATVPRRCPLRPASPTSTRMRFGSVLGGVGQELDRPVGVQPGDRDRRRGAGAGPRIRATRGARPASRKRVPVSPSIGRRHEAGRREGRGRQGDGVGEELRDVRAELLVEHPDDDPQARVELHCRERRC